MNQLIAQPLDRRGMYIDGIWAKIVGPEPEPWQLTINELIADGYFPRIDRGGTYVSVYDTMTDTKRTFSAGWLGVHIEQTVDEAIRYAENLLTKNHRASIEQAIKEGKPVRQRVLEDYPDLKQKQVARYDFTKQDH